MAKEIFISYSRKDFDKVKAIKDEIDRELGIDCWMDLDGIESGEQFKKVIIKAINEHDTMLFMLSANSMNSAWALDELNFAKHKGKRVVLVYIEPCEMSDDFYFDYHKYDTIDWSNTLQHDKLIENMHEWFGNVHDTIMHIQELAGQGDPEAQCKLGDIYYEGYGGMPQNYEEAVKWLTKAAEQGHVEAQNKLGVCYYNGKGVEQNIEEAVRWCRMAAEQGHGWAQYNLAYYYYNGIGVTRDTMEALRWLKKAALQGVEPAMKYLKELSKNII